MPPEQIIPFDSHYLFLAFLIVCSINYVAFFFAFVFQIDSLTDITGSACFIAAVAAPFTAQRSYEAHRLLIFAIVVVSRIELGAFLLYRVISRRRDARFDHIRQHFLSFGAFWTIQILWGFLVSFNSIFTLGDEVNPPNNTFSIIGGVGALIGFGCQWIGDVQKFLFRKNLRNIGIPCTTGLWRYSRHPNYLGEVIIWWSIFIISIPVLQASEDQWGWCGLISPIFTMFLLLFVSGIPTAEGKALAKYYNNVESRRVIEEYMATTSPLFFFPPSIYRQLPNLVKMTLFFDFPMYHYKVSPPEVSHSD